MSEIASLSVARPGDVEADLLIVGSLEGEAPPTEGLSEQVATALGRLAGSAGWKGRWQQTRITHLDSGPVAAVGLQGLGKQQELDGPRLGRWLDQLAERARRDGIERLAILLPDHPATRGDDAATRVEVRLLGAGYRFDRYQRRSDDEPGGPGSIVVVAPPDAHADYEAAVAGARVTARAVRHCRELANTPANEADPQWMAEQARKLAEERGLTIEVLGPEELEEKGMGGILAVGQGSASPPRLVRLEWPGDGPVIALVGKGVTFDTGGISIKPAQSMDEMKFDKSGACTVLAVAGAVAELELPLTLRVYLPLAENMPDGSAYRPGDIVTCYNGKTVEILNTDAEGRMILADALSWAVEEGAETVVEYSTLTGASVVALGRFAAALYSSDDRLAEDLLTAAERSGERLWRMPMWREYVEQMKGSHADLKNAGERWGSANTAAAFLSQFVEPCKRWAHVDIAGPANTSGKGGGLHGATGYGVAFTVDWLRRLAAR